MSQPQIHVFISHSWWYSGHYDILREWIFDRTHCRGQASFDLRNFSVPYDDPIVVARTDRALRERIYARIARSHVIVIPTGMYAAHSNWIQKEIRGCHRYEKPILAVRIRGSSRTPSVVAKAAERTVGWMSNSVVDGIWDLYRGR